MPIYKRGKNWYIDFYDETGKRIRKKISENRTIAKEALANTILKVERIKAGLETTDSIKPILNDEFKIKMVDYIKSRYGHRTIETYLQRLTAFLNFLKQSNIKIMNLDQSIIENYISQRLHQVRNQTINNDITMLKTIFYKAVRLKLIKSNPFVGIESLPVQKKKHFFFTKVQIDLIYKHIPYRFKPHFYILLDTGIRTGELALLHWEDIDFENALLNITPRRSEAKMRTRSIPLSNRALSAFQERKDLAEHDTLVFCTQKGRQIHRNTIRNVFVRAKIKAKIRQGRVHDLRHTFASWLAQSGESIYYISYLLGHHSVKVTEIYSHLIPQKNDTEKMNRIFSY